MTEMTTYDFLIEVEEFLCEWNTHWKGNTKRWESWDSVFHWHSVAQRLRISCREEAAAYQELSKQPGGSCCSSIITLAVFVSFWNLLLVYLSFFANGLSPIKVNMSLVWGLVVSWHKHEIGIWADYSRKISYSCLNVDCFYPCCVVVLDIFFNTRPSTVWKIIGYPVIRKSSNTSYFGSTLYTRSIQKYPTNPEIPESK